MKILPTPPVRPAGTPVVIPPTARPSFRAGLVEQQRPPLRFSAHASARMQSRDIRLSDDDVHRVSAMADRAAAKGAKQSLFVLSGVALVVSITNRTVITAVDRGSMDEHLFTNVDSAALV